jgi:hypothetical protein
MGPMGMPWPFGGVQPAGQPQPTPAVTQAESDSSSDSDSGGRHQPQGYNKSDTALLTSSATLLMKLPKKRLLMLVEACAPELDATLIASLDIATWTRLIYLFARIRSHLEANLLEIRSASFFWFSQTESLIAACPRAARNS